MLIKIFKKQPVLWIALLALLLTLIYEPISKEWLLYIDYKTLLTLLAMMGVIAAMRQIHIFEKAAAWMLQRFHTTRHLVIALVFITFVFSMFIANDMALLTFLPFTFLVLNDLHQPRLILYTVVLQNIGANLGGMLTPFGNPQNLFLYHYFEIPNSQFLLIMGLPFLCSILLLIGACMLVKNELIPVSVEQLQPVDKKRTILYFLLFVLTILMVFRVVPIFWGTGLVIITLLLTSPKSVLEIDYLLLATFTVFFLFTGNISQIPAVNSFISGLVERSTYWYGILSCQLISNVPSAVLFARFTPVELYPQLLLAVNLGGMGTLVASLASLISFQFFTKNFNRYALRYLIIYTLVNLSFLIILSLLVYLVYQGAPFNFFSFVIPSILPL